MARRRDHSIPGGFDLDEAAATFLATDGTAPLFDGDPHWPDGVVAAAAWERCRLAAWRHDWREQVWPPRGAKWDGLPCRSGDLGGPNRERLEADLATLEAHKAERPDLADLLEAEYAEYEEALNLLLGLAAKHHDRWGPDLSAAVINITTRGHHGAAA